VPNAKNTSAKLEEKRNNLPGLLAIKFFLLSAVCVCLFFFCIFFRLPSTVFVRLSFCWCSLWRWWGRWWWRHVMLVEFTPLPVFFCFRQCRCWFSLLLLFLPSFFFLSFLLFSSVSYSLLCILFFLSHSSEGFSSVSQYQRKAPFLSPCFACVSPLFFGLLSLFLLSLLTLVTEMVEDKGAAASAHSRWSLLLGQWKRWSRQSLISVPFLSFFFSAPFH